MEKIKIIMLYINAKIEKLGSIFLILLLLLILTSAITVKAQVWKQYPYVPNGTVLPLTFPDDEGWHPSVTSEWWAFYMHLRTDSGYYVTGFLNYLPPPNFGPRKVYIFNEHTMGTHIKDVHRDGPMTAATDHLELTYDQGGVVDTVIWTYPSDDVAFKYDMHFSIGNNVFDLTLDDQMPPLPTGGGYFELPEAGYSYYYSQTKLKVTGTITTPTETHTISEGIAWQDRQWGFFTLAGIAAYEWMNIQLDTPGTALGESNSPTGIAVWQIYDDNGDIPPVGTIPAYRSMNTLYPDTSWDSTEDFILERLRYWYDELYGGYLPTKFRVIRESEGLNIIVDAISEDIGSGNKAGGGEWASTINGVMNNQAVEGVTFIENNYHSYIRIYTVDPPTVPAGLSANNTPSGVELSWDESSAGTNPIGGYRVYRSTTLGGPYIYLTSVSPLSSPLYTDTEVVNGETYYYVVSAYDDHSAITGSEYSNEVMITYIPLPGADITIDYANVIDNGPQYYGVMSTWLDQDRDLYLERYRELNGNLVCVGIRQQWIEPTNDNNDPNYSEIDFFRPFTIDIEQGKTTTYGEMFKSLAAEFPDMHFLIRVGAPARWNGVDPEGYFGLGGKYPPLDYAEHREFIRELARFLVNESGIPPEQLFFSFVNEPNIKKFFNGTQADLVKMANETRVALDQISPLIQMGGLDEVHGTSWTSEFYPQRPEGCCDMWTYHVYNTGLISMWNGLRQRAAILSQYGPVWVTEFADKNFGSPDGEMNFSSQEPAFEFAALLIGVWTEVDGIVHFRLADSYLNSSDPYLLLSGWVGHGLFADHRGTHADGVPHKRFPVYWVFANHYKYLGGAEILNSQESLSDFGVITGKKNNQVNIFVVNVESPKSNVAFQIDNLPWGSATVNVFNNLQGNTPIDSFPISGNSFSYNIPSNSSLLFSIETADLNNDGRVNLFDLQIVTMDFGKTSGFDPRADVVQNGEIDIYDAVFVASRFT